MIDINEKQKEIQSRLQKVVDIHDRVFVSGMCRIYFRSNDETRGFIAIGWYCPAHKMFQTDKTIERSKKYDRSSEQSGWNCRGLGLTPKQIGLRTRLHNLKSLYEYESTYWSDKSIAACWSNELTEKFLSLQPTTSEVKRILIGSELILELNCQNHRTGRGWVDNPDKPGLMKRDMEEYIKLVKIEAQKRQEIMQQIINSRSH